MGIFSDGALLCEWFMQLPSRKELPDYYKRIARPIDLNKVRKNVKEGKYQTVGAMSDDVKLLVQNTQVRVLLKKDSLWKVIKGRKKVIKHQNLQT